MKKKLSALRKIGTAFMGFAVLLSVILLVHAVRPMLPYLVAQGLRLVFIVPMLAGLVTFAADNRKELGQD